MKYISLIIAFGILLQLFAICMELSSISSTLKKAKKPAQISDDTIRCVKCGQQIIVYHYRN